MKDGMLRMGARFIEPLDYGLLNAEALRNV